MRIGLVACSAGKGPVAAPARELYTSQLFRAARQYVEREYDAWFILSAKHGLVYPATVLEPYDVTLKGMPRGAQAHWARRVAHDLVAALPDHSHVFIHAGADYRTQLEPLLDAYRVKYTTPLRGYGIGQQLGWYKRWQDGANVLTMLDEMGEQGVMRALNEGIFGALNSPTR